MFNIAFNFVNILGGESGSRQPVVLAPIEHPAENSESDSSKELIEENFEIGLFVSGTSLVSPIESSFQWNRNGSISGYKNHVAEVNPRPPKAA